MTIDDVFSATRPPAIYRHASAAPLLPPFHLAISAYADAARLFFAPLLPKRQRCYADLRADFLRLIILR
jgi:hypothetical protein